VWPGAVAGERVRVQRRPQLSHERCCCQAVAGNVADNDPDLSVGKLDHVVPIPADLVARREVARRDSHSVHRAKAARKEAALEHHRVAMLALHRIEEPRPFDRRRGPCRGQVQHRQVPEVKYTRAK
jgi:hypothetical protein